MTDARDDTARADSDRYAPAIATGDADAFGRWIACVETRLRKSLSGFAASVDTEAVVQESLLRVWNVAPRFVVDARQDGLLRLALRIARNLAIGEARRLGNAPVVLDDADLDALAARGGAERPDQALVAAIAECRESLPRQPAQALAARLDTPGLEPDRTLAERVGMRLNTFLQNITRARRLLAECLRRRGFAVAEEGP